MLPEPAQWVAEYGLLGLFLITFVGATLIPLSSEVFVLAALSLSLTPFSVFLVASAGNCLGASTNYFLGWWFADRVSRKLEKGRIGRKTTGWMNKFGGWSLAGSWLPMVGDPLCLAAGLFQIRLSYFVLLGLGTRIVRYAVIIALAGGA